MIRPALRSGCRPTSTPTVLTGNPSIRERNSKPSAVAVTGPRPLRERVYRVAIKPVAGELTADVDAVKILVGYDALVLVRPAQLLGTVKSERTDRSLVLRNMGNASRELFDGKQCDTAGAECRALPAKRLYPGASLTQSLPYDTPVRYTSAVGKNIEALVF